MARKGKGGGKIQDSDPRFRRFADWMTGLDIGAYVGVRGSTAPPPGPGDKVEANLVEIAAVNEFGSIDGLIPERSFLRSTLREDEDKIVRRMRRELSRTFEGKQTPREAMDRVGLYVTGRVKRKITTLTEPGNADRTIKEKGRDNPLVHTGRLRQSIDHDVEGGGLEARKLFNPSRMVKK